MKWNFTLTKTQEKGDRVIKEKEQKSHEWVTQIEHALPDFKMKKQMKSLMMMLKRKD